MESKTIGNFTFMESSIEGVTIIEPKKYGDDRGYFIESYHYPSFVEAGIDVVFVQDNQSMSKKGVLRGLHFQTENVQGKLVRVLEGEVFDVAVDLREGSDTYGKWEGVRLTADNNRQFYVPEGFAHGFLVLSDQAVFAYKCTDIYNPKADGGVAWDDPQIGIDWPLEDIEEVILSDKDKKQKKLNEQTIKFNYSKR